MEPQSTTAVETVRKVCRDGPLSETVVEAVAEATGVDVLELPPLYHVVDPDLLDAAGRPQSRMPSSLEIHFQWRGCSVLVRADGEVLVGPSTERHPADR